MKIDVKEQLPLSDKSLILVLADFDSWSLTRVIFTKTTRLPSLLISTVTASTCTNPHPVFMTLMVSVVEAIDANDA